MLESADDMTAAETAPSPMIELKVESTYSHLYRHFHSAHWHNLSGSNLQKLLQQINFI